MQEALRHNGVSYYEVPISTQLHLDVAAKLANNYYCLPAESPITATEIQEFTEEFDPHIYNSFGPRSGSNEALLLYAKQPSILPGPRKALLQALQVSFPGSTTEPLPYTPSVTVTRNSTDFLGLILIRPQRNDPYGLLVTVEALCRSPWSDPAVCAAWASNAIAAVSGALGGKSNMNPGGTPTQWEVAVPEGDTPLAMAFRHLGWLATDYLEANEDEYPSTSGQIVFSFFIGCRPRKDILRYFSSQEKAKEARRKRRK